MRTKRQHHGGSPHSTEPSKVVFVRGILPNTSEMEVQRVFEQYGQVKCVFLIPKQHQALVEFSSMAEAENLLRRQDNGDLVHVREQPVGLSFSKVSRITDPRKLYLSHDPTRILLFTLFHIEVQIDCDTFRQICGRYGRLVRVVLTKNGIDTQAIVEFDRADEAAEAKPNLNGADIYENCNTLRVEYVSEMVYDALTRDPRSVLDEWPVRAGRTDAPGVPSVSGGGGGAGAGRRDRQQQPLPPRGLQRPHDRSRSHERHNMPPIGSGPGPSSSRRRHPSPPASASAGVPSRDVVSNLIGLASQLSDLRVPGLDTRGIMQYLQAAAAAAASTAGGSGRSVSGSRQRRSRSRSRDRDHRLPMPQAGGGGADAQRQQVDSSGCILFMCGLSEQMNCDRLFNLLCMYGNVRIVKFFASHPNQAMVEMTDRASAALCVQYLHNRTVLGRRIVVDFARQNFLKNVDNLSNLPDGTPSVKDYFARQRTLNRFLTPDKARKNHPMEPCTTVYFWGVPPDATEREISGLLRTMGAPAPKDVMFFNNDGIRSGLMSFENVRDALDAICLANHADLTMAGRTCMLKLTFSESRMGGGGGKPRGRPAGIKRRASDDF